MARTFNGGTNQLRCSVGASGLTGAFTIGAWVRRNTNNTWDVLFSQHTSTGLVLAVEISDTDALTLEINGSADRAGQTGITNTDWQFLAVGKATGTATPRFHRWTAAGGWSHVNGGGTQGNPPGTPNSLRHGEYSGTTNDNLDGDIEVSVAYKRLLSDADVEASAFTLSGMLVEGPSGLWLFRQGDVAQTLRDITGGGANQASISGTTVTSRSCPYFFAGSPPIITRQSSADTTPPTLSVLSGPTVKRISAESGKDSTQWTFEANEAIQGYEVKAVPSKSSTRAVGTLIETGGAAGAGDDIVITLTHAELAAAGVGPGDLILAMFAQDLAGNWS